MIFLFLAAEQMSFSHMLRIWSKNVKTTLAGYSVLVNWDETPQVRLALWPGVQFCFLISAHLERPQQYFTRDAEKPWLLVIQGPGLLSHLSRSRRAWYEQVQGPITIISAVSDNSQIYSI